MLMLFDLILFIRCQFVFVNDSSHVSTKYLSEIKANNGKVVGTECLRSLADFVGKFLYHFYLLIFDGTPNYLLLTVYPAF